MVEYCDHDVANFYGGPLRNIFCLFLFFYNMHRSWDKQYIHDNLTQILKKPLQAQKQTIPHMKAPILSFFEPEVYGCGIIMGVPHPPPIENNLKYLPSKKMVILKT